MLKKWLQKWLEVQTKQKEVKINILKLDSDAVIPTYAKDGDAGMDLTATSIEFDEYGNVVYHTGLAMEIPKGYVGYIFPRSSVAKKTLSLVNAVGVIDSGYRGEIICKFKPTLQYDAIGGVFSKGLPFTQSAQDGTPNNGEIVSDAFYDVGDRVAQIIIMKIPKVLFKKVSKLSTSARGEGGFGSSGN